MLAQLQRDGTSQADRFLAALDPASVPVDDRTIADLVAFARRYARELRYFGDDNRPDGHWDGFLPEELETADLVAFLEAPGRFSPEEHPLLHRPHLTLFLVFLELLRSAQDGLNDLTRRHLDFYYRDVLRMARRGPMPDHLHVLFTPARGVDQVRVPAGTELDAGVDSTGVSRRYAIERDVLVDGARLARTSALRVDREVLGLAEARDLYRNDVPQTTTTLFELALGDPDPGDPLPPHGATADGTPRPVSFERLLELRDLLRFNAATLFLRFWELQDLMEIRQRRESPAADAEWAAIHGHLQAAGEARVTGFTLDTSDPRDFEGLLEQAVGRLDFAGLPEVESLTELYHQRLREDAQAYIAEHLYLSFDDFVALMQIKVRIDNDWQEVLRLLERAGQRQRGDDTFRLATADPADFDANVEAALGTLDWTAAAPEVRDLGSYHAAVVALEGAFRMSADEFLYVMESTESSLEPSAWAKVDEILTRAHRAKVYDRRRQALRATLEASPGDPAAGFAAMARQALGEAPEPGDDPLELLERLAEHLSEADAAQLQEAHGAGDWERVVRLTEVAQRNLEALPPPIPERITWLNLYPAEDTTALATKDDNPRWKTFGAVPTAADPAVAPQAQAGWAIASPLLAMAEGRREVVLTLGFAAAGFSEDALRAALIDAAEPALDVELTTAGGWITPDGATFTVTDWSATTDSTDPSQMPALQLTLRLGEEADPIAPLAIADGGAVDGDDPVLRLSLRQLWDEEAQRWISTYSPFEPLRLEAVRLRVAVAGLTDLSLRNDRRAIKTQSPFEPFTSDPAAGARLYLGHPELVTKELESLSLRIDWMGLPDSLVERYEIYGLVTRDAAGDVTGGPDFSARISLVDRRAELDLAAAAPLFTTGSDQQTIDLDLRGGLPEGFTYTAGAAAEASAAVDTWERYFQWELNKPDFQHQTYPSLVTKKSVAMAAAIANGLTIDAADYEVPPPYTPKIKRLAVDYVAAWELDLTSGAPAGGDPSHRVLLLHPFGTSGIEAERAADGLPFLPRFDHEGELYLGLEGVAAPRTVSLLFQLADGTADPDLEPAEVRWSYLDGDVWKPLDDAGHLRLDTTRGLINTGLVELFLEEVAPSSRLPAELYWLRATVERHTASLCEPVGIHAQAAAAVFVDRGNAADHFASPLPAGTVGKLATPIAGVGGVEQPYTSAGGRGAEADGTFNTRVSERLRHKDRAVSLWDYERLVLDRFPEIYKAKCIPTHLDHGVDALGTVRLVVIPDIRSRFPFDPFEPKAPSDLLADVRAFLLERSPPAAEVQVINASYVAVKVRVAVRFRTSGNDGYSTALLAEELNRYLSPWAYDEGADIAIGAKIYANSIADFLDRRPYVDYIADVRLFASDDGGTTYRMALADEDGSVAVAAERPDAVLVAAREHEIDLIPEAGYEEELLSGIEFMKLELDFVVT